ncbi:cathepsin L-like [Mercenaria mercenaria]|uniref:cathepsin L-like n=1 Tax=Mercenaria mercenaria TaxID=6596 RepID=UPI00234EDEA2|nr:cathepsin L-like [Mercenaria mercenaria]
MGINNFADLTDKEFEEQYTGLKLKPRTETIDDSLIEQDRVNLTALPKEVDWRNNDCVTRVKFQGLCGSCYAFAATGALEGHTCIKTKKLVSLSEQNIIDCTDNKLYANDGCIGGQAENAYIYVKDNGGIDTEKSYPYDQKVGDCKYSKENIGATAKGLKELPIGNEFALQKAVAWNGPVSVCIDSTGTKSYSHGIYDGKDETHLSTCSSEKVNHAMLVIGYGTSTNGQDYWLLKNSWGTTWGLEGYMKLVRNKRNRCGITTIASYPIV